LQKLRLRTGGWRENEELPSGTIIPGEIVSTWPISNRTAMQSAGRIRYFLSEAEAMDLAPTMADQVQTATAHAIHDAEEAREAAELGQLTRGQIQAAAMRAAKALKAQRQQELQA
jgi:hypothetical protein